MATAHCFRFLVHNIEIDDVEVVLLLRSCDPTVLLPRLYDPTGIRLVRGVQHLGFDHYSKVLGLGVLLLRDVRVLHTDLLLGSFQGV